MSHITFERLSAQESEALSSLIQGNTAHHGQFLLLAFMQHVRQHVDFKADTFWIVTTALSPELGQAYIQAGFQPHTGVAPKNTDGSSSSDCHRFIKRSCGFD